MINKYYYLLILYFCFCFCFCFCSISNASDHVIFTKVISGEKAKNSKKYYKKKYKLSSVFSEMTVVHVIRWRTKNNSGDILFTQWGSQCTVDSYTESNKAGVRYSQTNELMNTPCILSKKIPKIEIFPDFLVSYDVTLIQRRSYDGEYFKLESIEEIKFNKETGSFCSDSYGNIDDVCPSSMRDNEYK